MKSSSKAALLSALIFPGLGHIALKQYVRGSVLVATALAALSLIFTSTFQRALVVVDRINSGAMPIDSDSIADMVSNSASDGSGLMENAALTILVICWLIGIIDSYRIGVLQERQAD
jgi:hypothetical protein